MDAFEKHVSSHAPKCLAKVHAMPEKNPKIDGDVVVVTYGISLDRVSAPGRVLGYDLRKYNADYKGDIEFISPLSLESENRQRRELIFDSDKDGYNGQLGDSAKLHGKGASQPFVCKKCGNDLFFVKAKFSYAGACRDLWADEPETKIENYFEYLQLFGTCSRCHTDQRIVDMDL